MPYWALITNHAAVLLHIARHPRTTAREICDAVGITERATRKIIADLNTEGYISKKKEGRRILYAINQKVSMRHTIIRDVMVGEFLEALGWEKIPAEVVTAAAVGKREKGVMYFYQPAAQKQKLVEEYEEQSARLLVF